MSRILVFFLVVFAVVTVQAGHADLWSDLNSSFTKVLAADEIVPGEVLKDPPASMQKLDENDDLLAAPAKDEFPAYETPYSEQCQWRHWLSTNKTSAEASKEMHELWDKCEPEFRRAEQSFFGSVSRTFRIYLDMKNHPMARWVLFQLPNGKRLKGFLLLKPGATKRPLVIFRAGIMGSSRQLKAERFAILGFFDQSPFHVLFLESSSGQEYLSRNHHLSFAGYEEGEENAWVAEQIQSPKEPLAKVVKNIHMAALSLGGHGAFRAVLLKPQLFKSATMFCPLMNIKPTIDYHMSRTMNKFVIGRWISFRLKSLHDEFPSLTKPLLFPIDINELFGLIKTKFDQNSNVDYWTANDWWSEFKNLPVPIRIFATAKDPIVIYEMNAGRLEKEPNLYPGVDMQLFTMKEGYHCTVPGSYNAFPMNEFFLRNVREHSGMSESREVFETPISESNIKWLSQFESEDQMRVIWIPTREIKDGNFLVRVRLHKVVPQSPWVLKSELKPGKHFVEETISIPLRATDYEGYADLSAEDLTKATPMIGRWLMQNMELERRGSVLRASVRRYR